MPQDNPAPSHRPAGPVAAGLMRRVGAVALDFLAIQTVLFALNLFVWRVGLQALEGVLSIAQKYGALLYFSGFTAFRFRTYGQEYMGLSVLRLDRREMSVLRAGVRTAIFLGTIPLAPLNAIVRLFNPERRTLHDLLCGTWVVEPPHVGPGRNRAAFAAVSILAVWAAANSMVHISLWLDAANHPSFDEIARGVDF